MLEAFDHGTRTCSGDDVLGFACATTKARARLPGHTPLFERVGPQNGEEFMVLCPCSALQIRAWSITLQDFRKLNRTAAKCGVRTLALSHRPFLPFLFFSMWGVNFLVIVWQWRNAKDLAEFRKHTDIKLVPPGPMGVLPKVIPSDVIPSCA